MGISYYAPTRDMQQVIIIAHRLSTIKQAHRIVTVEEGMITKMDNHEDLLAAGGRYSKLLEKQVGGLM